MTTPKRIAIFYSQGPHFDRAVQALRQDEPDAQITAMIPSNYPMSETTRARVNEVASLGEQANSANAWNVIRLLRRTRYDCLVVLFPSEKLRLLAALSGAHKRQCFGIDGQLINLDESVPSVLVDITLKRIKGTARFFYIWTNVHLFHVKPAARR